MPASTLDTVNTALRSALAKNIGEQNVDAQLAGTSKKAILTDIEFEPAGSYQSTVLDKLKSKYIVFKGSETPQPSKPEGDGGADETLKLPSRELYPFEAVQLGWSKCDWTVGAGMINMGNTCYLNSTLQALFHVPALVNWLISDKEHTAECQDSGGLCIICAMRKTLQDSQQRNVTTIRPLLIYNKLRIVCRNLIPGRQEDAHEFLRYLVEAMEKSYLNRFKNSMDFDSNIKETTPLNQILGGYLRSAVRCLKCGHVSTTFQHFQDLLLDIRKAQTVDEALDGYFSREKLDDDSYHCQTCQKKVPATKQFSLERAPMVLCIQLKRFSVSNNKITKHIHFRQRLDLTKFARHHSSVPLIYRLVALVTHMGPTVNCGHYTAVAQAPTGIFYQFDDSMVRVISHQAVFNTNAYIMLYELESSPFAQKSNSTTNKQKLSITENAQPVQTNAKVNGIGFTSDKVYGPELPPEKKLNGTFNGNGKKHEESSGSSDSDPESSQEKSKQNSKPPTPPPLPPPPPPPIISDSKPGKSKENQTKLVPYETDDSSCSEESNQSELDSRVSTKAALGEWKITSSELTPSEPVVRNGKSWTDKKKSNSVLNDLYKMSYSGYSAPVLTWNGTRSHLNREINNERREDRKRTLMDSNADQGRIKHQKLNNHNSNYKSNVGYNPIQEFHNAKNWSQNSSGHYKSFYNGNRHRRNFHHKSFHKNYRFRQ